MVTRLAETPEPAPVPGPSPHSSPPPFCAALMSPHEKYLPRLLFELAFSAPTAVFVAFLIARLRPSYRRLVSSRSHIMSTYYAFLWVVCGLNILRCFFQLVGHQPSEPGTHQVILWLLMRCGMVMLEVSVVVFLSQGYLVSGWEALMRTVIFSGIFAAVDLAVKATYVFGFHIPLFIASVDDEGDWRKWSYWSAHAALFLSVYVLILVLPHTRWKDRLPARPSFYRYIFILSLIYAGSLIGSLLLGFGVDLGYCLYGLSSLYTAFYPPLLYVTFLADFFREEDLQMEDVYYSEMKDAGYFDVDWD